MLMGSLLAFPSSARYTVLVELTLFRPKPLVLEGGKDG